MVGDFGSTTLKTVGAALPERLIMTISSFLKRNKKINGNSAVSTADEKKLSSFAKTLLNYAVLVLAVETASNLGKAIAKMQNSKLSMGTRKALAVLLTFATATGAQFALKVQNYIHTTNITLAHINVMICQAGYRICVCHATD